ncbi:HD-GYP domain-containing protein [Pseudoxanthomonas mexicana]|uniref:HD-GYP domain-containing protein n=1 Tax=Pseudoxanthomonas mexicana TaxID=128785 RepID=UPI00398B6D67
MLPHLQATAEELSCSVHSLAVAMDERDLHTRHHCDRTSLIAQALGRRCGIDRTGLVQLGLAAAFHDVGKIGIPDRILYSPRRLEGEEWEMMRSHSERGERIFAESGHPYAGEVARLIRLHHESVDGSGYPDGLKGEAIPLGARILAIVDGYDAMTSHRPYQQARTHEEAMRVLFLERGRKVDVHLFDEFERMMRAGGLRAQ